MKIIDLSMPIYSGMPVYPEDPKVVIELVHSIQKQGWRLRKLSLGSHTGTHVDSFSHMDKNGISLDKIHLSKFFGPAQAVTIDQELPKEIGLIFTSGQLNIKHFKKISAARPSFISVGTGKDSTLSIKLERKLLQNQIITFTDLINLNQLPQKKTFIFYGFPLKIKDGDGSPVRAIAMLK